MLVAALPSTAAAAQVDILTPKEGSRTSKRVINVRVRVEGKRFEAFADGHDVTSRFSKRGRIRRARLVRGRHLPLGDTSLLVSAGRGRGLDADQHRFTTTRPDRDALRLHLERGRLPWAAPHLVARTDGRVREARVWLNGKRVTEHFEEAGDGRGIVGRPGGHLGLRHGRNRVRVYVLQRNGVSARRALRFRIPRNRPIASAGSDLSVGVGDRVRLNGRASDPPLRRRAVASQTSDLNPSWKLVSAPPGSEATLAKPGSAFPSLIPDETGTYIVRLTVGNGPNTSVDEVEVSAAQVDEAMGTPIQTITRNGAVQIGYPSQRGSQTKGPSGSWVQVLELNPTNGDVLKQTTYAPTDAGASNLLSYVGTISGAKPVVLTGQGKQVSSLSKAATANLAKAIQKLGGTVDSEGMTPGGAADLANGQWSLIGRNGLPSGAASQSFGISSAGVPGLLDGDRGRPGSLNGYLQTVRTDQVQFVSPEFAEIDTKFTPNLGDQPSPTQNQIKVGAQLYSSATIPNGALAMQLVVLDPSTLSLVDNQTFELFGPGSNNPNGGQISQLAAALHRYVAQSHTPGSSPLIILQDFGAHPDGNDFPGRFSQDWVNDSLPDTWHVFNWSGQNQPASDLAKHWNSANQNGTVAGNIGNLADSTVAHDIVANYRRPYLAEVAPSSFQAVNRTVGGLTVVASANLYQRSAAFVQGQPNSKLTNDQGRVTGVLRRNGQSQWELDMPAPAAGFAGTNGGTGSAFDAAELVSIVNRAPTPWPCSDAHPAPCPVPKEIDAAMAFIAGRIFGRAITDVREKYDVLGVDWTSRLNELGNVTYESAPNPSFSRETFDALKGVLAGTAAEPAGEFDQLADVDAVFVELEGMLQEAATDAIFGTSATAGAVTSAVKQAKANRKLLEKETEADAAGTLEGALELAAYGMELSFVIDPVEAPALEAVPAALGVVSSLISLGEDVYGFYDEKKPKSQKYVEDDTGLIQDEVHNLSTDFSQRYSSISDTLEHYRQLIKTDSAKLALAEANVANTWNLRAPDKIRIKASIGVSLQRELFNSLMPIAYKQWLISPHATNINPGAFADQPNRHYNCFEGEDRPVLKQPFSTSPFSSMTSVMWNPYPQNSATGPAAGPFTVRALIANDDPIELSREPNFDGLGDDDVYIRSRGTKPPASLTDPLFGAAEDIYVEPNAGANRPQFQLGMSKEEFFGQEGWTYKRLQCGVPR